MSKGHRHGRDLHPVRAAAGRWRAEGRRAQTGPGAPVHGCRLSYAADAPASGWLEATPCMRPDSCCTGWEQADAGLLRQPPATVVIHSGSGTTWLQGVGLGAGVGDCV